MPTYLLILTIFFPNQISIQKELWEPLPTMRECQDLGKYSLMLTEKIFDHVEGVQVGVVCKTIKLSM